MSSPGWQREVILQQVANWLDQTAADIDSLELLEEQADRAEAKVGLPDSHAPVPHVSPWEDRFRSSQPTSRPEAGDAAGTWGQGPATIAQTDLTPFVPSVGLLQVVESLTAMRHELKLQTKSARGLEQTVEQAVTALQTTVKQLQGLPTREQDSAEQSVRPVLESLAMLDESLQRGRRALELAQQGFTHALREKLEFEFQQEWAKLSSVLQWTIGPAWNHAQKALQELLIREAGSPFQSVLQGYQLIQQRLQQRLELHGVTRIPTVGRIVDAKCMTVVALAEPDAGPPETVIEEYRPGYRWRHLVLRFAEVSAVPAR